MFPQTYIHTFHIHTYLSFSRYVCSPETYIPLISRYVPFDHTYIHTYLDGGGRQGLPARYLLTSANEVCRKHTDLENDRYVCMSGETIGMYVCMCPQIYIPLTYINTTCTLWPHTRLCCTCTQTYIHTIHTCNLLGMYVSPDIHTYIPTYIHTYIQGMYVSPDIHT